jgi:hypothetical protein
MVMPLFRFNAETYELANVKIERCFRVLICEAIRVGRMPGVGLLVCYTMGRMRRSETRMEMISGGDLGMLLTEHDKPQMMVKV